MDSSKERLRNHFQQQRHRLSAAERERAGAAACLRLLEQGWLKECRILGLYHPIRGEISPMALLKPALEQGIRCALPKVESDRLAYYPFLPESPLLTSRLGIAEPHAGEAVLPDLLIIPLLAFDREGHRLGYGGGYFDRLLADPVYKSARRVGFAYDWQETPRLPSEPHDVRVSAVITDQRVVLFP